MTIAQEEIFGPVICLIPYNDIDEAIKIANDTQYGLSSMISCSDPQRGQELAKKIRAGQVIVNRISRAIIQHRLVVSKCQAMDESMVTLVLMNI